MHEEMLGNVCGGGGGSIVPDRTHSCRPTALSEISNRIVGKNITMPRLISRTIFLPLWGLQIQFVWSMGQFGVETKYGVPTVREQWVVGLCVEACV